MAFNLTYDPSNDPEAIEAQDAIDAESLEIGEQLQQQQDELLAGKYRSAEELEKAYIELQKKLGSKGSEDPDQTEEPEEQEIEDEEEDPYISFLNEASDEYYKTGELSEETLESFTRMSSTELVDAYLRWQQQMPAEEASSESVELSSQDINQVQNSVGGEANYQALVGWAADNFNSQEIEAFNSVMDSGNLNAIGLAVQALYYRYTDANGFEGNMLKGKAAKSMDSFRSQAELVRAMSDPRYDRDPAYRQDIYDKLERSNLDF